MHAVKCLTEEHLLEVARLLGRPLRPLASPVLLDAPSAQSSPQRQTKPSPANEIDPPQTASFLPSPCLSEADLIQKLSCLETKVVTLRQLAQLALALLQERERSVKRRITALESLMQQIGGKQMLPDLPATEARQEPRRLNPAEQLARSRMPALIEYGAQGTYVIISWQEGELHLVPRIRLNGLIGWPQSPLLASWESSGVSPLTAIVTPRALGGPIVTPTSAPTSKRLGVTDHLTILRLEQVAAALRSDMASL